MIKSDIARSKRMIINNDLLKLIWVLAGSNDVYSDVGICFDEAG